MLASDASCLMIVMMDEVKYDCLCLKYDVFFMIDL